MDLEEMLTRLAAQELAKVEEAKKAAEEAKKAEEHVSKTDLVSLFAAFKAEMAQAVEAEVAKAMPAREEGAGRKGPGATDDGMAVKAGSVEQRDADPVAYIVAKSKNPESLDQMDKDLIAALTFKALAGDLKLGDK